MKFFYSIIIMMFVIILTSCESSNSNSSTDVDNPFSNGGNERNMIVVISDIHLGADIVYTETKENLSNLAKFLEQIRVAPNIKELIIAGDLLDEWFVPAPINTYAGTNQTDFVQRIATTNKIVIDAFKKIITEAKVRVTYVPGNHDLTITRENIELILPGINQARDDGKLGLGAYSPTDFPSLAVEHGHRYNFFCAPDPISNQVIAPGTIMPPGYFFTRIAALWVAQGFPTTGGDLPPVVTPNTSGDESQQLLYGYWNSWATTLNRFTIKNKYDENLIVTNVNGFNSTFSVNDLLPFQTTAGGVIDVKLYKGIQDTWEQRQTLNNVAVHVPTAHAIEFVGSSDETDYQAKNQYFLNTSSGKRIVVFGHSHVAKIIASQNHQGLKSVYANSGTWIDENPELTTMNFVVITPQSTTGNPQTFIKLYNFEGGKSNKMAVDSLVL